jgi:hypothetical protein
MRVILGGSQPSDRPLPPLLRVDDTRFTAGAPGEHKHPRPFSRQSAALIPMLWRGNG